MCLVKERLMQYQTVPLKEQLTSGRPVTLPVMGARSFPPAECIHVFTQVEQWRQIRDESKSQGKLFGSRVISVKLEACFIIPVTPFLKGNIPILPKSDQSCSVPVNER